MFIHNKAYQTSHNLWECSPYILSIVLNIYWKFSGIEFPGSWWQDHFAHDWECSTGGESFIKMQMYSRDVSTALGSYQKIMQHLLQVSPDVSLTFRIQITQSHRLRHPLNAVSNTGGHLTVPKQCHFFPCSRVGSMLCHLRTEFYYCVMNGRRKTVSFFKKAQEQRYRNWVTS